VGHGEFLARFLAPPEFDLGLIAGCRCLRLAAYDATEQGRHFISKTRPVCASVPLCLVPPGVWQWAWGTANRAGALNPVVPSRGWPMP